MTAEFDALDKAAVNARAVFDKAYSDNLALLADNTAKAALLAQREQVIAQQATEIAALKAGTTTPPVPVPDPVPTPNPTPGLKMLLGATIDPHTPLTRDQTIAAWIANAGPLGIVRVFISGAPTAANIAAALAPHVGKRHRILSYKGDGTDTVLLSIPKDGFDTYLVKYHEPENDGGTHTAAWFKAQQATHIAQVKRLARPDLIPAFVLMGWTDNDTSTTTSSSLWFPDDKVGVVMLLDPYPSGALAPYVKKSVDLWTAAGGTRWGIAELGWKGITGAALAKLITDGLNAMRAAGCECVCWFHSAVNGAWWLDDPAGQAAWKAQTAL